MPPLRGLLDSDNNPICTSSSWMTPEDMACMVAGVLAQVALEHQDQFRAYAGTGQLPAACSQDTSVRLEQMPAVCTPGLTAQARALAPPPGFQPLNVTSFEQVPAVCTPGLTAQARALAPPPGLQPLNVTSFEQVPAVCTPGLTAQARALAPPPGFQPLNITSFEQVPAVCTPGLTAQARALAPPPGFQPLNVTSFEQVPAVCTPGLTAQARALAPPPAFQPLNVLPGLGHPAQPCAVSPPAGAIQAAPQQLAAAALPVQQVLSQMRVLAPPPGFVHPTVQAVPAPAEPSTRRLAQRAPPPGFGAPQAALRETVRQHAPLPTPLGQTHPSAGAASRSAVNQPVPAAPAVRTEVQLKYKKQVVYSVRKLLRRRGRHPTRHVPSYPVVMTAVNSLLSTTQTPSGEATPLHEQNDDDAVLLWKVRLHGPCEQGQDPPHIVRKVIIVDEESLETGWSMAGILEISYAVCFVMGWLQPNSRRALCSMNNAVGCHMQWTNSIDQARAATGNALEDVYQDFEAAPARYKQGGLIVVIDYPMMMSDLKEYARGLHHRFEDQDGNRRKAVNVCRVTDISAQAWQAVLSHCADFHVLHNDVKPENFLITKEGIVLIHDLGAATHACVIHGQLVSGSAWICTKGYAGWHRWQQLASREGSASSEWFEIISMSLTHLQLLWGCHQFDLVPISECFKFWVQQLTLEEQQYMSEIMDLPENTQFKQLYKQSSLLAKRLQASVDEIMNCTDKQGPGSAFGIYKQQLQLIAKGILAVYLRPNIHDLVASMQRIAAEVYKLEGDDRFVLVPGLLEQFEFDWPAVYTSPSTKQAQVPAEGAANVTEQPATATEQLTDVKEQSAQPAQASYAACSSQCMELSSDSSTPAPAAADMLAPSPSKLYKQHVAGVPDRNYSSDALAPAVAAAITDAPVLSPIKLCKQHTAGVADSLQAPNNSVSSSKVELISVGYEHITSAAAQALGLQLTVSSDQHIHSSSCCSSSSTCNDASGGSMQMCDVSDQQHVPSSSSSSMQKCNVSDQHHGLSSSSMQECDVTDQHQGPSSSGMGVLGCADGIMTVESGSVVSTSLSASVRVTEHGTSGDLEQSCTYSHARDSGINALDVRNNSHAGDSCADDSSSDDITSMHMSDQGSVRHASSSPLAADECLIGRYAAQLASLGAVLTGSPGPTQRVAAAAYAALASGRSVPLSDMAVHAPAATALHSMPDAELPLQASSPAGELTGSDSHASKLATVVDFLLNTTGPTQRIAAAAYAALVGLDCHGMSVAELAAHARSPAVEQSGFHSQSCPSEEGNQWYLSQDGSQSSVSQGYRLASSSSGRSTLLCSLDAAESVGTVDVMDEDVSAGCKDEAAAELPPLLPAANKLYSAPAKMRSGLTLPNISAPDLYKRTVFWLKKKAKATTHVVLGCFNA